MIVVRNGVGAARAFEQSEIMSDEAEDQENGAEATGDFAPRAQKAAVRAEAEDVGHDGQE